MNDHVPQKRTDVLFTARGKCLRLCGQIAVGAWTTTVYGVDHRFTIVDNAVLASVRRDRKM